MTTTLKSWLEKRFPDYAVEDLPRTGKYGAVWLMSAMTANVIPDRFALKTINLERIGKAIDDSILRNFEREIRIWLRLPTHFTVLPALGLEFAPAPPEFKAFAPRLPLVRMPCCDSTLADWVSQPIGAIDLPNRLIAIAQLCNGLAWLYRHGIEGHGDLKPANVLVRDLRRSFPGLGDDRRFPSQSRSWQIRVADLGWVNACEILASPTQLGGHTWLRNVTKAFFARNPVTCSPSE